MSTTTRGLRDDVARAHRLAEAVGIELAKLAGKFAEMEKRVESLTGGPSSALDGGRALSDAIKRAVTTAGLVDRTIEPHDLGPAQVGKTLRVKFSDGVEVTGPLRWYTHDVNGPDDITTRLNVGGVVIETTFGDGAYIVAFKEDLA